MNQKELFQNLDELDEFMKAQITRGGNSERREWAGTTTEDQKVPSNTKNGTDYKPPTGASIAHKAIGEMTAEEIENYLAVMKSRVPNPRAAEAEITALEGVTKALCPTCTGTGRNVISKSVCDVCGGHGVVFDCANEDVEKAVQSIAEKYNVGGQDLLKGPSGVDGDGDTTPTKMDPFEPVKLDNTGKMVGKGDDEAGDVGGEDMMMETEDMEIGEDAEKCASKSVEQAILRGFNTMTKGLKAMWNKIENIEETQNRLASHQVKFSKSILGIEQDNGNRTPARGPMAVGPGVQALNKGFVGNEPGSQGSQHDVQSLKRAGSQMVYEGLLDPMEVYRLDANGEVSDEVIKSIEGWIEKNGVPRQ
jgi:hypothetical protein